MAEPGPGSGTLFLGPGLSLGAGLQLELSQAVPRVRRGVAVGEGTGPWPRGGKLRLSEFLPNELPCEIPEQPFPLRRFNCQGPALGSGGGSFSPPPQMWQTGRTQPDVGGPQAQEVAWGRERLFGALLVKRALIGSRLWRSLLWP